MKKVFLFVIFCQIKLNYGDIPKVLTPLGPIEGTVQYTYTNRSFFQFEGIPYAAPPIGKLRYEFPQPPNKWNGVLKATVRTFCYQYSHPQKNSAGVYAVVGDEDCLYYNVYTPTLNQSANLDVLIHIHGGSFMYGSGGEWRPDIILNRPIVYVSINYRLGPLGFLSTEDNVLPGNLGLRDQQQALLYIKRNIKYFGGNPNSITLNGFSAGSASLLFHLVMPSSKGLFQKGIASSGSVLNNWVLMDTPLEKAKKLASLVGCPTRNSITIKSCLKSKPARLIVQNVKQFQPFLYNPFSPWSVVVDGYWSTNPLVPDHPLQLLRKKQIHDVPLLVSFVTSEGLYPGAEFYSEDQHLQTIDTKWNEVMPHILMYNNTIDHKIINQVSQIIRKKYLRNDAVNKTTYSDLIQAISDRCFIADIEKGLKLYSAGMKSPVWSYMYDYRGENSLTSGMSKTTNNIGVSHGDDLILFLRQSNLPNPAVPNDIAMSNLLLDMVMSFVKSGTPNITDVWKPVSKNVHDRLNILKINRYNDLVPLEEEHIGQRLFWDSLPFNENEKLLNVTLGF